jgi:hypothetical protein
LPHRRWFWEPVQPRRLPRSATPWAPARPTQEGRYYVANPQSAEVAGIELYVSSEGKLQDVRTGTYLHCTPTAGPFGEHMEFSEIAVAADGSFEASKEFEEIFEGQHAMVKYEFSGHVHGANSSGVARIVGRYREELTYDNGSK